MNQIEEAQLAEKAFSNATNTLDDAKASGDTQTIEQATKNLEETQKEKQQRALQEIAKK